MMDHRTLMVALLLLLTGCAQAGEPQPLAPLSPLRIEIGGMAHTFNAVLVDTPERRRIGLMFRKSLPKATGMLFDFHQEQPLAFWMKNTPLSLDMIFINDAGRVVWVARDTEPFSTDRIITPVPARAVLEVEAGTAVALRIGPGARVRHAIFGDVLATSP